MDNKVYTIKEIQNTVNPIFRKHGMDRVYLFGSYARNEANVKSDVDLLIEGGNDMTLFALGALYDDLITALDKPIDLVTVEALKQESNKKYTMNFKQNIQEDELLIYENVE